MVKGLYTAYTGMVNEQRRLDVLANNLANANTTGYKKEGMVAQSFDDALAIKIKDTSVAGNMPKTIGIINYGVKVGETFTNWDQGSMQITDKSTDMAISGEGFYAVAFTNKSGETSVMYSRDGAFTIDVNGYLKTVDGDYILNQEGATNTQYGEEYYVKLDPKMDFTVDEQGYVFQNGQMVTKIGLVDVENYDYLEKYGENLYTLLDKNQLKESSASILQGCLESSNVNVVDEMVMMIQIARAYEANQKVIQTEDSTIGMAVGQVGKV